MSVRRLGELTYEAFRALDRERLVVVLPVGATEAHGPHLPLATDVIIAEAMAERGARKLALRGLEVVIAPPLAYSVASYAAGFAGTISLRAETASSVIEDIAAGLASHGVRTLAVANAHLEPSHIASIRDARERIERRALLRFVFPDVTQKPWVFELGDEFKSGACHAGQYEGSIVLAARPDLVDDSVRRALPPNPSSLSVAIRAGKRTFEEAGGPRAYFGFPANATAEEGERTIEVLGNILERAVWEVKHPSG